MQKRGAIEIQFNWIMVVVVGGLILLFVAGLMQWGGDYAKKDSASTVSRYLDSLMTGASTAKETVSVLELPFSIIEFDCTDGYRVNEDANVRRVRNKIVFAPKRIERSKIVTWALGWDVPFRVTNFLYVSSPSIRYIFKGIEGDALYDYLKDNFPSELGPEFNPGVVDDKNDYKIRIIYVNQGIDNGDLLNLVGMAKEDVNAITIMGDLISGNIQFYRKAGGTVGNTYVLDGSSEYLGKSTLIGSIFSEDRDDYECNIKKAFGRLSRISKVYSGRAEELRNYYSSIGNPACSNAYSGVGASMNSLTNFNELRNMYTLLINKNRQAQQYSCALIY